MKNEAMKILDISKFMRIIGAILVLFASTLWLVGSKVTASDDPSQLYTLSPGFVEVDLKDKDTKEFQLTLKNGTGENAQATISIERYELKDGKFFPSKEVLADYHPLRIDKESFLLPQDGMQEVRVTVNSDEVQKNEYEFLGIVFSIVNSGQAGNLGLSTKLAAIVAVRGKNVEDSLDFKVIPGKPSLPVVFFLPRKQEFIVQNTGKSIYVYRGEASLVRGRLNTRGKILDTTLFNFEGNSILPGEENKYELLWSNVSKIPWYKQLGYYSVRSNIKYGVKSTTKDVNYEFFYIPVWLLLVVILLLLSIGVLWNVRSRQSSKNSGKSGSPAKKAE